MANDSGGLGRVTSALVGPLRGSGVDIAVITNGPVGGRCQAVELDGGRYEMGIPGPLVRELAEPGMRCASSAAAASRGSADSDTAEGLFMEALRGPW
eukprot:Skav222950  [mRNA]  locus=scaffold1489:681137:691129:- [translate_table: standard]